MALPKIVADLETSLTAKIAVGGTTGTIASNIDDDGVTLADGVYYFTIDGNNSAKEHIRCTKTGTGLSDIYSYSRQGVATSGTVREHRVGAKVIMTDYATYKNYFEAAVMSGPGVATDGNLALFDGTTGQVLKDGGLPINGIASATDNAIARFDSTTGKLLQNSALIVDDLTGGYILTHPVAKSGVGTQTNYDGGNSTDDTGGVAAFQGGSSLSGNNAGGPAFLKGGSGFGSGNGGVAQVSGGTPGATGAGGAAIVQGGAGGATSGNGGDASVKGGDATAGDSNGGSVIIAPGSKSGSGVHGGLGLFEHKNATYGAFLNLSLIASANKTFTFPNKSGTFAMTTDLGAGTSFSTTQVFTGASPTTYTDLDLSGVIGATQKLVLLKIVNNANQSMNVTFRTNGDSSMFAPDGNSGLYGGTAGGGTYGTAGLACTVIVKTDTAGVVEWKRSGADSSTITVEAYW